jgi:glycosyltransferase involved in cell wall biosynthesis
VVDDASTDRSATIVERLGDPRVRLIRHTKNRGECPARNTGVQAAAGSWIVFLDSKLRTVSSVFRVSWTNRR